MCSPKAPAAPDPIVTANAQAAANKETAIANTHINQVNQVTPYGNLTWSQRGTASDGTPQYTATTTLSAPQQAMLDEKNKAGLAFGQTANMQLGKVKDSLARPFDLSGMGAAPVANEATRTGVRDALMARLAPQFEKDRQARESELANRGIGFGSGAWNDGMDELNRAKNDARLAAEIQSGTEMANMYGLQRTARDSAINEMVMQRQIPLNELNAMLTQSQVQGPQFINPPQTTMQAPDIMGATYAKHNSDMNAYNQKMGQQNAMMGGLFSVAGAGLGGYASSAVGSAALKAFF